jgi:hypothetical protein
LPPLGRPVTYDEASARVFKQTCWHCHGEPDYAVGERHSAFEPTADETPRLVAALLARGGDETGNPRADVRGMPFGYPALSPEEVQLVESWVAQGRPRQRTCGRKRSIARWACRLRRRRGMRASSFIAGAVSLSLLATACTHRSERPAAAMPELAPKVERRPPPGTRIDTWPDLGVWSTTGVELPGSSDPFLWEKASTPPKAQVPLRLHRPVE